MEVDQARLHHLAFTNRISFPLHRANEERIIGSSQKEVFFNGPCHSRYVRNMLALGSTPDRATASRSSVSEQCYDELYRLFKG